MFCDRNENNFKAYGRIFVILSIIKQKERTALTVFEMNSSACSFCSATACFLLKGKYLCLPHFSTNKAVLDYTSDPPQIINDNAVKIQNESMQRLWKDAIADVILKMYDNQKIEEDLIRQDPLAILSMAIPSLPKLGRIENTKISQKRKLTLESSTASSLKIFKHNEVNTDPFQRKTKLDKPLLHISKNDQNNSRISTINSNNNSTNEKNESVHSNNILSDNPTCQECSSRNTRVRYSLTHYDTSRSETWGMKDSPAGRSHIECFDSKREKLFNYEEDGENHFGYSIISPKIGFGALYIQCFYLRFKRQRVRNHKNTEHIKFRYHYAKSQFEEKQIPGLTFGGDRDFSLRN
eukprot:gene8785-18172_t